MKSVLSFLLLATFVGQVKSQEPLDVQIEFIRRLRDKGYHDLALEQIDKLKANPATAGLLGLERARTLVAIARAKEPEQQPPLLNAARTEFEAIVHKDPSGPEGARGRLEMARLSAYLGQAFLTRAQRDEDGALAKMAEQQFMQAEREFAAAVKPLAELAANHRGSNKENTTKVKQQLSQDLLQARFDRAGNFLDLAHTYIDTSSEGDNRKRAEALDQAKQAFQRMATDGGPMGLLASAWLIKVNQEGQDPTEAEKYRKRVMEQTGKAAQPAQRLARLFYIQGILKSPAINLDTAKKCKLSQDEAKKWLAAYPSHHKTPEGWAVRFELAQALFLEAQAMTKDAKGSLTASASTLSNEAQKQFAIIAESGSSLAEKAKAQYIGISMMKLGANTAVADLKDFESCYLKAQIEIAKMKKVAGQIAAAPSDRDKLEAERKEHLKAALQALNRGLTLANAKTAPPDLDEARFLLASGYMLMGDWHRAAGAAEALGRARPPTKRSAQASAYAIECYANILKHDNADSNRQHLKGLADYVLRPDVQKDWAREPVTAIARYQLAMLYNRDGAYKEAIAQLERLPTDFSGYSYAQGQLVFIAQKARAQAKTDQDKQAFADTARKAILRTPRLPADADAASAAMYFFAQLELAKLYYADASLALEKKEIPRAEQLYNEMQKSVAGLRAALDKSAVKLPPETRAKLDLSMAVMAKHAQLGLADLDYRKGDYDRVLRTTADVVAAVEKAAASGTAPIRLKDYEVTGAILGLALRANVQKGNVAKAKLILGYLDRLTGEEGGVAESSGVLRSLIGDLQAQIKELKKANDPAKFKATVKVFSAFIDELANKGKALDFKNTIFLASCYSSLEEYSKAANLYAKIAAPKALDKDQLKEDDEKEIAAYWFLRVQYAKALRLSAHSKDDLATAKKVLDNLERHKNARMRLQAEVEQIHILEDSAKFGTPLYGLAMKGWSGIMNNAALKAKAADDPGIKEVYFDAYYGNASCLFKLSQTEKAIAAGKEQAYVKTAAKHILRLEKSANQDGWHIIGQRFRELLNNEKKLRDEYESLKKSAK